MPLKPPVTGVDCARGGVAGVKDNIAGEGEDTAAGGGEDTAAGGGEDTAAGGGEDTAAGGGDAPFAGDPSSRENISPFCLFYRVE